MPNKGHSSLGNGTSAMDRVLFLSPLTKAAVQVAYRVNVANLCDTSHSTQPTPTAAMAEQRSLLALSPSY